MESDRSLTYYTRPESYRSRRRRMRARDVTRNVAVSLLLVIVVWFLGLIFCLGLPTECFDPNSYFQDSNTADGYVQTACTSSDVEGAMIRSAVFSLGLFLIGGYISLFGDQGRSDPPRLVLTVTPDGMTSPYSRFPQPVVGWEDIQSFGVYEEAANAMTGRPRRYLAVTVRSADGLHDSPPDEAVWKFYSFMPDVDRVAIMLPLELVYPDVDTDVSEILTDMLWRIQTKFADEIAQYRVVVLDHTLQM